MRSYRVIPILGALVASTAFAAKPVLRVNGAEITDVELTMAKRGIASQMPGNKQDDPAILRRAVDQVVGRMLLLQAARDAKVVPDPQAVAASVEAQRKQAGGAESFAKALASIGFTEQDLNRRTEDSMTIHIYVEKELAPKHTVADGDVKKYYDGHPDEFKHPEQVKLRMILAMVPPNADESKKAAAKDRAEAALKRVKAGEDFGTVAGEVSDDPSKARKGEIGWVRQGLLLPELEGPVFALKAGNATEVLQSKFGYHVFKADDRRGPGTLSFDEVKENLSRMLTGRAVDDAIEKMIAERRAKATIEAVDPTLQAALESPAVSSSAPAAPKPATEVAKPAQPAPAAPTPVAAKPSGDAPKKP
jgi:peptidyl-prolyl cis-trans isomerase C